MMLNDQQLAELLDKSGLIVSNIRAALPHTLAIYAFGSYISGDANADSDLDLAVLVAGYAEPVALWELSSELAEITDCEVDLLDFRAASTVMQHQILMCGKCLWCKQPQTGLFEGYVLSEKTALDKARTELLADIKQQGSIYAR